MSIFNVPENPPDPGAAAAGWSGSSSRRREKPRGPSTWRDLIDQLTPRQFDELSRHEAAHPREAKYLLVEARSYVEQNLDDHLHFGDVAMPEGAMKVYLGQERQDGKWFREFAGTVRPVAGVSVYLDGTQFADGTIERDLTVGVDDLPSGTGGRLTPEQAREFAAALIEAADELERLA